MVYFQCFNEFIQFLTSLQHSFEHASHVTQSVSKLLSRLVEPTVPNESIDPNSNEAKRLKLQIHTFESAADPTLRFAVVSIPVLRNSSFMFHSPQISFYPSFVFSNMALVDSPIGRRLFLLWFMMWTTQVCLQYSFCCRSS